MKLTFLGAAAEVTGSCYLLEARGVRFLVDCGLFQGRHAPQRNRAPFAFDAREIAFVLLSHAHIDHSGMLPRLSAAGFKGPVYTTTATRDLLGVLLPDSAYLQERDAAILSANISVWPGYGTPAAWSASLFNGAVATASTWPARAASMLVVT